MAELDGESVSLRAQLRTPSASRTAAAALSAGSLFGPSSSCRDSGGSQQQLFRDRPALWDLLAAPRRRGASSYRRSRLYKSELCRSWSEAGWCSYGRKCQFAHGTEELKEVARHPKYKTRICRTYLFEGFCPYGARCRFVHDTSADGSIAAPAIGGRRGSPAKPGEAAAWGWGSSSTGDHSTSQTLSTASSTTPPPIAERMSFPAFRADGGGGGRLCAAQPAVHSGRGLWQRSSYRRAAASLPDDAAALFATPPLQPHSRTHAPFPLRSFRIPGTLAAPSTIAAYAPPALQPSATSHLRPNAAPFVPRDATPVARDGSSLQGRSQRALASPQPPRAAPAPTAEPFQAVPPLPLLPPPRHVPRSPLRLPSPTSLLGCTSSSSFASLSPPAPAAAARAHVPEPETRTMQASLSAFMSRRAGGVPDGGDARSARSVSGGTFMLARAADPDCSTPPLSYAPRRTRGHAPQAALGGGVPGGALWAQIGGAASGATAVAATAESGGTVDGLAYQFDAALVMSLGCNSRGTATPRQCSG